LTVHVLLEKPQQWTNLIRAPRKEGAPVPLSTDQTPVERINRRDRLIIGLTGIIAAGGIVSAFIFWYQLQTMRDQLTSSEKQIRAYVSLEAETIQFAPFPKMHILVRTKNTGYSPAYNIRAMARADFRTAPLPENYDFSGLFAGESARPSLFPNGEYQIQLIKTLTAQEMSFLKSKGSMILVCVTIDYDDVFGKTRKTEMCSFASGQDIAEHFPASGKDAELVDILWVKAHDYAN
jgi:hypothetical protein